MSTMNISCAELPVRMSAAELANAKAVVRRVCDSAELHAAGNHHAEIGRRLYKAVGEIDPDDWPDLFGRGGITGPSYLATAYALARQRYRGR